MDETITPFPCASELRCASEPHTSAELTLLDAARAWRRHPGTRDPVPEAVIRRLAAAGLLGALTPLDNLMSVITVQAREPLVLGAPGDPVHGPDARLLAWIFCSALRDGEISEVALDRLTLRVSMGSRALLGALLKRLVRAVRPRMALGILPAAEPDAAAVEPEAGEDGHDFDDPLTTVWSLAAE